MNKIAFTAVYDPRYRRDPTPWSLGLAEENVAGYQSVKESGTSSDPFFVSKFPTRFASEMEAQKEANNLNQHYFNLNRREAFLVVVSSMKAQNEEKRLK